LLCVKEAKRIHHEGSVGAPRSKRQPAHVSTNPTDLSATFGREVARSFQQGDREIEANDLWSTLRKGKRMPPVPTADIDDARCR
jgi:hypothetical protein